MEKKPTTAVAAGVMLSLIIVVISLVTYFSGMYMQTWTQYVAFAVIVGGIIWAVVNHGKEVGHTDTFGKLFGFGFKVTAVVICLMVVYTFVSGAIFPDIKRSIIEAAKAQQLKKPGANEDQIEQGMKMFEDHYNLFIVLGIVFWYMLMGVISSLIGAGITKKSPPPLPTFDKI